MIKRILFVVFFFLTFSNIVNAKIITWSECTVIKYKKFTDPAKLKTINDRVGKDSVIINLETKEITRIFINQKGEKTSKILKDKFSIEDSETLIMSYEAKMEEGGKKFDVTRVHTFNLSDSTEAIYDYIFDLKLHQFTSRCKSNDRNTAGTKSGKSKLPGKNVKQSGTAFFVSEGYLITNRHVVKECKYTPNIYYNDSVFSAEIISMDKVLDLALLKTNTKNKYLNFSNNDPEKLQKVIAAGYPFGRSLSDDLKLSMGVISSVKGFGDNTNELQIDAAINSGNSGGPIINYKGELVAVAVSGMNKELAEGINFGIKAKSVSQFLKSNSINTSYGWFTFEKDNRKLNKLLEEVTVYIYCD
ncbi:serine protease [Candidatus Pelagibacter sp.]|nr:serine protease [Candidatus Pelagibacter sp.]